jgi:hypothetical protein
MIHVKEGVLRLASVEIIGITHRKLTNSGQFTGGEQVIL